MFEKILEKFGYTKLLNDEETLLNTIRMANATNTDVFIDSLKRKKTQKIYLKKGKTKAVLVKEIKL